MEPLCEQNNGNEPSQSSEQDAQGEEAPEASPGEHAASDNASAQNREIVHGDSLRDTYLRIRNRRTLGPEDAQPSPARGKPDRSRRKRMRERERSPLQHPQKAAP